MSFYSVGVGLAKIASKTLSELGHSDGLRKISFGSYKLAAVAEGYAMSDVITLAL